MQSMEHILDVSLKYLPAIISTFLHSLNCSVSSHMKLVAIQNSLPFLHSTSYTFTPEGQ